MPTEVDATDWEVKQPKKKKPFKAYFWLKEREISLSLWGDEI